MANMRQHDRVKAGVPVDLQDGTFATTLDVSPNGVFIATDGAFHVGQTLRFSIEFDNADGRGCLCLDCVGTVRRVVEEEDRVGIGVSITESWLERRSTRRTAASVSRGKKKVR